MTTEKLLSFESNRLERDFDRIVNDQPIASFKTEPFNKLIGGGIKPQFVMLAAEPGCGKTTAILQMADELAEQGNKVIFFTFEMSAPKLVAKSLSRLSHGVLPANEIGLHQNNDAALASVLESYSSKIAENIAFVEKPMTASEISLLIGRFERTSGIKPIVFLDYVQIIPPESDMRFSDERSSIKRTVASLRNMVNKYDVPLLCVSSVNRVTYKKSTAGLDSLAESSALEYTADNVLFLTTKGKGTEHQENMRKPVREVTITSLKNRYGSLASADLVFDTQFATFRDA